jgi:hypothetical protein
MMFTRSLIRYGATFCTGLGWSSAQAQDLIEVTWSSGQGAQTIPTLSMGALTALAVFLAVMSYRLLAKQPRVLRALLPLCVAGTTGWLGVVALESDAGITTINASSCNGSQTYSSTIPSGTPCFVNSCGETVTINYRFLQGGTAPGVPLSEVDSNVCAVAYSCGGTLPPTILGAINGSQIPSGAAQYGLVYCDNG